MKRGSHAIFDLLHSMWRAAGLRCPRCGKDWQRQRVILLSPRCVSCGLAIDRGESDYFLGSYTVNLVWSLMAAVSIAVAALAFPRSRLLVYGLGLLVLVALAIVLHPMSRLMWLAIDLQLRPATPRDLGSEP
jgi:uncharacterized protein (DUF983 family)